MKNHTPVSSRSLRRARVFAPALLLALLAGSLSAQPQPPVPGTWQLEFEDTFDGTTLNGANWKIGMADAGIEGVGGNNPKNITVAGGKLTLKATTTPVVFCGKSNAYSTGEISTFLNFKQQYGYFEMRARWDTATGMWPAFWLMPERDDYATKEWFVNTFLKFNLVSSGITTVTSAKLRMKVVVVGNSADSPNNLQTFRVADDSWAENTITWNNQPVRDPRFVDQKWGFTAAPGDIVEIDVTELVQSEVSGDKVVSLALSDSFRRARRMAFYSKEAVNIADRPQLVVNGTTFYPTADAIVKWGTAANTNYGSTGEIEVRSAYADITDSTYTGGMEVDIMETLGVWGSNVTSHALHWDGYGSAHQATGWGPAPVIDTGAYHDYGAYWANGLIEFYVDGVKTGSYNNTRAMSVPAYAILSLQLGGWDGNTPTAGVNNKTFDIEHVRIWSGTKSGSVPATTTRASDGKVSFGSDYSVYGGTGSVGNRVTVANGGTGFSVSGNGWIKFPLNYTVTPDTVLEFTVNSAAVGEILGFGLDEDNDSANAKRVFQLSGTQLWTGGWQDSNNYVSASGSVTYTIDLGTYYTGPMTCIAIAVDNDAQNKIYGAFSNVKIHEGADPVAIGALNSGVAVDDSRTGTGYLMYSAQNVVTRFGTQVGNADHLIAVFYSGGQWYADKNFGQVAFTPVSTDLLLASVNFTTDTVTSLLGASGAEYGIVKGYASGDLTFIPNQWAGAYNANEFGVTGTTFTP
ncbi:MAG TPA: DNRLRE domain-containing protein [Rariglobus sp.]|nr:DNRLRE domain-containing protein [Rariglobus sp.]